MQIPRKIL